KYHVYPLNADLNTRMAQQYRPSLVGGRTSFTYYPGDTRYSGYSFPATGPRWRITASLAVAGTASHAPVLVPAAHFGGQALILDGARAAYIHSSGDPEDLLRSVAPAPLAPGKHEVTVSFKAAARGGALVELAVDGKPVAQTPVAQAPRGRGEAYIGRRGI